MAAVRELRDGRHKGERIMLVLSGNAGHSIHYFLQDARPTVVGKSPLYRANDPVTYDVGGARLTTVSLHRVELEGALPVDVNSGDVVWLLTGAPDEVPAPDTGIARWMPSGLTLGQRARMTDAPTLWTYRVERVNP